MSYPISQSPGTIFFALCDMSWHYFLCTMSHVLAQFSCTMSHIYGKSTDFNSFHFTNLWLCDPVTKWEYSQISKFKKKNEALALPSSDRIGRNCRNWLNGDDSRQNIFSLHANPLARSPGQVKLDSDKWQLWKNLLE